nr:MAG TPA: hypothetical protein [Caudoviricetes sp.]
MDIVTLHYLKINISNIYNRKIKKEGLKNGLTLELCYYMRY